MPIQKWLQEFAYRIDLSVWLLIPLGLFTLLLVLIITGYQTIKAAQKDSSKSLRQE
jgi:putative ABC transport system permease protein